jgi:hypothetical protein
MKLDPRQKAQYLATHVHQGRIDPYCRIEDNEERLYQNLDPNSSQVRWDNGWSTSPKYVALFTKEQQK